jgi:two-component system NtrC family sensor kinase
MKIPLLCFLFVFALSRVSAQKTNVDSLIKVAISAIENDKTFVPNNPDSLLKRLFVDRSPAARIRMVYDIILLDNGELNPARALYYHHKILDLAKKNHDPIVEAVITGELGYTLCQDGDAPEGLKMLFDALQLAEKTGNKQAIGTVYNNLGNCVDNNEVSISYYKKALKYSTAGGDNAFAVADLSNLGIVYVEMHNTDSANYFLLKSIALAVHSHFYFLISRTVTGLGVLQTDDKLKLKYYRDALMMSQSPKDAESKGRILLQIAKVYLQQHRTNSALLYAKNAYGLLNAKFLARRLAPAQLLAQLYTGKNADSALKYTTTYYTIKDSLYSINKMERAQSLVFADQQRQQEIDAQKTAYQTTLRLYLMVVITIFLLALAFVFWRNNSRSKKANSVLQSQKEQIQNTLLELKQTQTQLIQAEKMASLGELTAGIAHEIQNPLNFVNNFSEVNQEMIDELEEEIKAGNTNEALAIAADIKQNQQKINHHGKRADFIVKGMLQHSRTSTGEREPTNINTLADEFLKLSYHGLRAKDKNFNAELVTHFDETLPRVNIAQQDIGRVLLNLFNNAFYAVNEKAVVAGPDYKPTVTVSTCKVGVFLLITVRDNGAGIPQTIVDKIYQPFFTTKPTGQGTGLGLSLSYDIVKANGGDINVETGENTFTQFNVQLPLI